jgi:ribosomal protein S4
MDEVTKNTFQGPMSWLRSDLKKLTITITGLPTREEAESDIKEQLIVEYYSR